MYVKKKKYLVLLLVLFLFALVFLFKYTSERNQKALQTGADCLKDSILIVDAGHGGMDGGTVATDGTPEKEINLSIAKKLDALLRLNGIQTRMTRTDDNSIHDSSAITVRQQKVSDIHNRLKILHETENTILVSIHQNHFSKSKYHGTQVFFSGNDPQSAVLASCIQQAVISNLQPDNTRETKKCGTEIYLLYHAQRPAVMVECGFLSNTTETALLKTETYQQQMAMSIFNGILNYFSNAEEV